MTRNGPNITYLGQPKRGAIVETFNVNVHVKKGEYVAISAKKTSILRCNSGGTRQLLFQPALVPGDPFETADDDDGCELLLEAIYE